MRRGFRQRYPATMQVCQDGGLPMIRSIASLCCVAGLAVALCVDAQAQGRKRVPRFEDYPVADAFRGKSADPILETQEQKDGATYYRAVAEYGANFAGHYAVVALTCGNACSMVDFLDAKTGKIVPGPFSNSGWKQYHDAFRDIEFRRDSRLIVFAGSIDDKRPLGWHFYLFDNGKLKKLHTIVTRGDFRKPLSQWMYPQRSKAGSTGTR
jgi:hypothetical protein